MGSARLIRAKSRDTHKLPTWIHDSLEILSHLEVNAQGQATKGDDMGAERDIMA